MGIPNKQIGWGTKENLLWQIAKQLERVTYQVAGITGGGGGGGGVSSVGLASPTVGITISGSPVTSSGTLTFQIATASALTPGLLSSTDWTTFNSKQGALTLTTIGTSGAATLIGNTLNIPQYSGGGGGGGVTSVAALTLGTTGTDLSSTVANPTTTPVITLNVPTASATNRGVLSSGDWTTFNNKVTSVSGTTGRITSSGGTTPAIDLASGIVTAGTTGSSTLIPVITVDTYGRVTSVTTASNPQGTVTSVAALTIGTTGTDLSSTVANGTTTPVITLNIPTASVTNRGVLSAADWATFNNKQSAITLTTTGTSGPATLVGSTLNIPQYAGGGGGFTNPMTTLGDIIYGAASGTATRLAGNITSTKNVLLSTGNGTTASAPTWGTLTASDVGAQASSTNLNSLSGLTFASTSFVKMTAAGTFALDTNTYLTGNQSITLSGDVSGTGPTAISTTIGNNVVTFAKMQQIATASFLGRTTAATGNVENLTSTQATELLNTFTSSLKGLAPASGGGTTNFLRADGTWAAPPGGGGTTTNAVTFNNSGTGDSSGTTFNGSVARTISFNTVGANKVITSGTAAPTGGVDGDIYLQYT